MLYLLVAIGILPLQPQGPLPVAESNFESETNGQVITVGYTQRSYENSGNDTSRVNDTNFSDTLPVTQSNTSASEAGPVQLVSDAGAAAVFEYSRNCFAADDHNYECIFDHESEEADEADGGEPGVVSAAQFNALIATQFAQLHVTGSGLDFQPNRKEAIYGIDFILATSPDPHSYSTELFNTPITIRATPVHYHWDMGDGNTISTTDPGKHHPDQTVTHMYEEPGTYTITLTTTWAGHFSIANNPTWYPIAGTITTTETSFPITHKKYRTVIIPPPEN